MTIQTTPKRRLLMQKVQLLPNPKALHNKLIPSTETLFNPKEITP